MALLTYSLHLCLNIGIGNIGNRRAVIKFSNELR